MDIVNFLQRLIASVSVVLLISCGGGGSSGGSSNGPNDDLDDDGFNNSVDIDDDNDGLIEIATLEELDWVRNDLLGQSRDDGATSDSTGCPASGCNGYELVNDLDFDTNGNGSIDAGDAYYMNPPL